MSLREIIGNLYNKFFNKEEKIKALNAEAEKETERRFALKKASGKTYKCSDEVLKERIRRRVQKEIERKDKFKKTLRAGVIGVAAIAAIPAVGGMLNKENKQIQNELPTYTVEATTKTEEQTTRNYDYELEVMPIEDLVDMYNDMYPDEKIEKKDLKMVHQNNVAYVRERKDENGKVTYIEDSWNREGLKENEDTKYNVIKDGYVLIAKDKIISAIGEINGKYEYYDARHILAANGEEFLASENKYEYGPADMIVKTYKKFYEERLEKKEAEKKQANSYQR